MRLLRQISHLLGLEADPSAAQQDLQTLQVILDRSRRHKRSGKYAEAIADLDQALLVAKRIDKPALRVAIKLHQAEVYTRQGAYENAYNLLVDLQSDTDAIAQTAQSAYLEIGFGVLAQEQGNWDQARLHYEQALSRARENETTGPEGRAQAHLADVYLHDGNASYATYLLQEALPKLNAGGDIEMSSYFVGRLGQALIETGKQTEGQQLLGRALRIAEQMEYRQYELLWREALAVEAMQAGLYAEARRHLLLVLAHINVDGEAADQARVLCRTSKACLRLGEQEAALDYANQAVAAVVYSEADPRPYLLTQANLGVTLRSLGRAAEALTPLVTAANGYSGLTVTAAEYSEVDVLRNLAAAYTDMADYAAAAQVFDRLLTQVESSSQPLDVAGIQRDRGIFLVRQGGIQEGIQAWMAALRIYESQGEYARVAKLYCDIGNLRRQYGQPRRAMKDYEQALMLLGSISELETRGIVLSNAAIAYIDYGDVETAEAFFVESIQIAQKRQDRHAESTRRGNYGWFLLSTGRPKLALSTLEYAVRQSENLNMSLQAAVQTGNIGLAYDEMGNYEQAVSFHARAWERLKTENDPYWQAYVSANLGHTLISLDRADEAETLLSQALKVSRGLQRSDVMIRALNGQARLALLRHDMDAAGALTEEAVTLGEKVGLRRLQADALLLRGEWHARNERDVLASGDWSIASELYRMLKIPVAERRPAWLK